MIESLRNVVEEVHEGTVMRVEGKGDDDDDDDESSG